MKYRRMSGRAVAVLLTVFGFIMFSVVAASAAVNPRKQIYESTINELARKHNVPSNLVHSIILAESNYNSRAVSVKGAVGLMQLMPETAKTYGVKDSFNFYQNIEGGIRYLKDLIALFNGETKRVLAAYNAGQEAVKKYDGIPPFAETREYINRVMASFNNKFIPGYGGSRIIKYYDEKTGHTVLTNDPFYTFVKASGNK